MKEAKDAEITDELIAFMHEKGFFCAPASSRYHGAYVGGLYDHSKAVTESLKKLTEDNGLKWQKKRSPFVIGMLHDLCKIDDYVFTNTGIIRNPEAEPGHAEKSLRFIKKYMDLTVEEEECIRHHMGAFNYSDWAGFSKAVEENPNVLWTHHADMIASHVMGI